MKKRTIKNTVLSICLMLMLTSCATIFSGRDYVMNIHSDVPQGRVVINDVNYKTPAKAAVTRSKEKLKLQVLQNDSIINEATLKPHLSMEYWLGNMYFAGLAGYLIDLTTEKRFTYGENLYLDTLGNVISKPFYPQKHTARSFQKHKQGSINLMLNIPEINVFLLHPKKETFRNSGGFVGIGAGAEYFYKDNKSLQLHGDAIMDYVVPFYLGDRGYLNTYETCDAINMSLTDNFHINNRFQLGYGLNFARNTWILYSGSHVSKWDIKNMLGLAVNAYYRYSNRSYVGVIYRPSFWDLQKNKIVYEHSISFDLMWKIPLNAKK